MSADLTPAKRRADVFKRIARTNEARAYYEGLRLGLVHAGRPNTAQHGTARARAYHESDTVDVTAYARSCGYVDGVAWDSPTAHVGLLRLAILLRADGSARAYAATIQTDERTVRRWLSGERPIAGVTLALLEREVDAE